MIDVEKVREGLRCCRYGDGCTACPYYESDIYSDCAELIRQAYELLRPRLLTKDELQGEGRPFAIWVEEKHFKHGEPFQAAYIDGVYRDEQYKWALKVDERYSWAEYGKRWRCWTQWPSEEDRRREAWDDEKEERDAGENQNEHPAGAEDPR